MKPIKQVFEQEMHSCGPSNINSSFTVEVMDAGGGKYLVMHAKHWAIDNATEIAELMQVLTKMLEE